MNKKVIWIILFGITVLTVRSNEILQEMDESDDDEVEELYSEEEIRKDIQEMDELSKELEPKIIPSKELFEQAKKNFSEKKYAQAKENICQIMEQNDDKQMLAEAAVFLAEEILIGVEHDYQKGVELYRIINTMDWAPQEQIKSWVRLGNLFANGLLSVPRNEKDAIFFFKKLAKQRVDKKLRAYANFKLGDLYQSSWGCDWRSPNLALDYYRMASNQEDNKSVRAQTWMRLAEMASYGDGDMPKSFDRHIEYLEKAAQQTDDMYIRAEALIQLGLAYSDSKDEDFSKRSDYKRALKYFQMTIDQKDAPQLTRISAHQLMAKIFAYGLGGIEVDYKKMMDHLNAILDLDEYYAQILIGLGDIYRDGLFGAKKNYAKAIEYYKKANRSDERIWFENQLHERLAWVKEQEALANSTINLTAAQAVQ